MRAMLLRPILLDALEAPLMGRLEFKVLFQSFVDVGVDGSIGTIQAFQESRPASEGDILAGEVLSRLNYDRAPAAAIALTTDSSVLTAIGSDYGYERVRAAASRTWRS